MVISGDMRENIEEGKTDTNREIQQKQLCLLFKVKDLHLGSHAHQHSYGTSETIVWIGDSSRT